MSSAIDGGSPARRAGLAKLLVTDGQEVERGQALAIFESNANAEDVLTLEKDMEKLSDLQIESLRSYQLKDGLELGNMAQGYAKAAIDEGLSLPLTDGLRRERELFVDSFRTEDAPIGIKSFLEQGPGKAAFTGR